MSPVSVETMSSQKTKPVVRKKFAVPPVKVACLDCRASRTRCDGKQNCSNCVARGKTCTYAKSQRGGSRIRKRKPSIATSTSASEGDRPTIDKDTTSNSLTFSNSFLPSPKDSPMYLVTPGAGLKHLDSMADDTDYIFDAIFNIQHDDYQDVISSPSEGMSDSVEPDIRPILRVYSSDEEILAAYYVYIHIFFPILPPPTSHQVSDNPEIGVRSVADAIFNSPTNPDFEPSSPLSLAISATLALIPHPDDPDPSGVDSTMLRREQSQAFAQSALESIEIESEMLDSILQPAEALSSEPQSSDRKPFHPQCPVENESILALLLLSGYEYAQRGNIVKMRTRSSQALDMAMALGLHSRGHEEGRCAEANRRTWWMTYICVCQGSILSNTPLSILLYDLRFTTSNPTIACDLDSWSVFCQAQQAIVLATQFVIDMDFTLKSGSDMSPIWERMLELEAMIEPLVASSETWITVTSPSPGTDSSELVVAQALRHISKIKLNSARIKLHRYCAFSDMPIFTKKHCDLASASDPKAVSDAQKAPLCGCSTTFHQATQAIKDLSISPTSEQSTNSSAYFQSPGCNILPFSSHFSSKVCLRSALNIARAFKNLPLPPPTQKSSSNYQNLSQSGSISSSSSPPDLTFDLFGNVSKEKQSQRSKPFQLPRMMPLFACCAMQSSYAMVMLSYKTKAQEGVSLLNGRGEQAGPAVKRMLEQLDEGLRMILDAMRNYTIAYEALGGMRDQIELAASSVRSWNP